MANEDPGFVSSPPAPADAPGTEFPFTEIVTHTEVTPDPPGADYDE